jgi:hypothetical protein
MERNIKEIQPDDILADDDIDSDEEEEKTEHGYDTWVNHQGRITPKGLVKELARFPQSLHVIEDAETIFDDKNAWGVLRMALHSQDHTLHSKRRVTWKTSIEIYDFFFTGSLIIVGNRLLPELKTEVDAVKTRCPFLNFDVSNLELVAKMKELCERGYKEISAAPLAKDDCYTVLEFLLSSIEDDPTLKRDSKGAEKKLNLRILISGFRFLALSKLEPSINWRNMLLSQLKEIVGASKRSRKERIYDEALIAGELAGKKWPSQEAKLVEWCKRTGRSVEWSTKPKDSEEYQKGFNSAKTDFKRKAKRA